MTGGKRNANQHEDGAESISDDALQGTSPTRSPKPHLPIREEAAQQASSSTEKKWRTRSQDKSDS